MDELRKPSLDGATLRIDRANRHFNEFEKMHGEFRQSNKDKVIIKPDSSAPRSLLVSFDSSLIVPLYMSLPVSDCIHNLRAALDYLVYELALLDSGAVRGGTQFPIEDCPKSFSTKRRNTYLCGLSDNHIRAIELLQPYSGIEWTRTLRAISNPDKHRHLVVMQPCLSSVVHTHSSGDPNDAVFTTNGEQTYLKKEDAFAVGFTDSPVSVVETLNLLIVQVSMTIDAFKPEFRSAAE
jgi:hypothetical protein